MGDGASMVNDNIAPGFDELRPLCINSRFFLGPASFSLCPRDDNLSRRRFNLTSLGIRDWAGYWR